MKRHFHLKRSAARVTAALEKAAAKDAKLEIEMDDADNKIGLLADVHKAKSPAGKKLEKKYKSLEKERLALAKRVGAAAKEIC